MPGNNANYYLHSLLLFAVNANFRFWHGVFIFLLFLTAVLLVICLALWVALGVIVGTYDSSSGSKSLNATVIKCVKYTVYVETFACKNFTNGPYFVLREKSRQI